jgi:hypothetical protein
MCRVGFTPPPTPPEASFPPPLRRRGGVPGKQHALLRARVGPDSAMPLCAARHALRLERPLSFRGEGETTPQAAWGEGETNITAEKVNLFYSFVTELP